MKWRKYHEHTHRKLEEYVEPCNIEYGGNLSVRIPKDTKPMMLVGQDEITYHQHIFSEKGWKGSAGHNFILPKGVGEVLLISGFQAREIGLGLNELLIDLVLEAINQKRKGTNYVAS